MAPLTLSPYANFTVSCILVAFAATIMATIAAAPGMPAMQTNKKLPVVAFLAARLTEGSLEKQSSSLLNLSPYGRLSSSRRALTN